MLFLTTFESVSCRYFLNLMKKNLMSLFCCLTVAVVVACKPKEIIVRSVTVSPDKVTLTEGKTTTLVATVSPADATDPSITWSSSNRDIVTVNPDGEVTAVSEGQASVTAKANNGLMANCAITVESAFPAVDMGLSVRWCTCNLGATKPEEPGGYYAWGETSTKTDYDWSTYTLCNGANNSLKKYCTMSYYGNVDDKLVLEAADDAAVHIMGGDWRMPTQEEFDELMNPSNCTWTWDTENGANGYRVTSKKNGNSIFLPAAGGMGGIEGYGLVYMGERGFYWSSSLYKTIPNCGCGMAFGATWFEQTFCERCVGENIRPVRK